MKEKKAKKKEETGRKVAKRNRTEKNEESRDAKKSEVKEEIEGDVD